MSPQSDIRCSATTAAASAIRAARTTASSPVPTILPPRSPRFRAAAPHVTRIVGFGNCDAASTLALFGRAAGIDALLLANPWVIEPVDDLPPAAAIRARYAARLRDPLSLLRTGIDLRQAWRGLRRIVVAAPPTSLSRRVIAAIESWQTDATILLAATDATAQAFHAAAPHLCAETIATGIATVSQARRVQRCWLAGRSAIADDWKRMKRLLWNETRRQADARRSRA